MKMADGVPVVRAPEEIDITNAEGLLEALVEAAAHSHGTFVADMTGTRFCDSSGIHALISAYQQAGAHGGEMILAIPSPHILRILAITGVNRIIPSVGSVDEALARIGSRRQPFSPAASADQPRSL
jgi:anti-anti-sigma factor